MTCSSTGLVFRVMEALARELKHFKIRASTHSQETGMKTSCADSQRCQKSTHTLRPAVQGLVMCKCERNETVALCSKYLEGKKWRICTAEPKERAPQIVIEMYEYCYILFWSGETPQSV